jgi:hypothetical protein
MDNYKVLVDLNDLSVRNRCDCDYHRYFTKTDYGYFYDNGERQHHYQVAYVGPKNNADIVKKSLLVTLRGIKSYKLG